MGLLNTYPQIAGLHAPTHIPGGEDVVAGVVPAAHEDTHVLGGTDDIDSGLSALAINLTAQGDIVYLSGVANTLARLAPGVAGQALLTGGAAANSSWGAPTPAAHVLATTGPHTDTLPLTDLVVATRGEVIHRGAADWEVLATGTALQALLSGGAGADVYWGAPTPAAHVLATTGPHTDTLPLTDLVVATRGEVIHRGAADWEVLATGTALQALLSGGAGADVYWGAPTPAAHATTHESGGSDETRNIELLFGHTDEVGSGLKILITVGENVVTGDTLYKKADGKYWKADADSGASMPALLIVIDATIAADATGLAMSEGPYRNDDRYNWTVGDGEANLLFQHTTGGAIVQLANKPTGAGDQVQVVGWVENADEIYFRPSLELVEVS